MANEVLSTVFTPEETGWMMDVEVDMKGNFYFSRNTSNLVKSGTSSTALQQTLISDIDWGIGLSISKDCSVVLTDWGDQVIYRVN